MYSCTRKRKRSGTRPDESNSELPNKFTKLIKICSKNIENFKASDIYDLMFNIRMYEIAYHKLKSNPGNMTPGIDQITLDGISHETFLQIIKEMKDGSFRFKPGRRVYIPKSGGKTRPLTIAHPRDKIVQEVIRMILEAIFEPTFLDCSHGFRRNRGCHTALRQVKTQFGAASFYIEGDISKCFDSFDHKILVDLIRKRVNDERFIQLINKTLNAGYMEFHQIQRSIVGTPQGSVISPILSNIYLHELDKFVNDRKLKYEKGKEAKRNPIYRKFENLRQKALKEGNFEDANQNLKEMQKVVSRLPNDPNFRRLYYVRYADDWIIS